MSTPQFADGRDSTEHEETLRSLLKAECASLGSNAETLNLLDSLSASEVCCLVAAANRILVDVLFSADAATRSTPFHRWLEWLDAHCTGLFEGLPALTLTDKSPPADSRAFHTDEFSLRSSNAPPGD